MHEIHRNLLTGLAALVGAHAAFLANPLPGHEPVLREIELKRLKAEVRVAETMCRLAGVDGQAVRLVMEYKYAEMAATP